MFKDDKINTVEMIKMKNHSVVFSKEYCPSKIECLEILKIYGTPKHVQEHCKAVALVASAISKELNKKGLQINVELVESAGYLHDIARVHKIHEKVGADYLKSIGLDNVSKVIIDHTKHKINKNIRLLDEEDVLCIADRVVLENKYVGPKIRMEYIMNKAILKYGQESKDRLDQIKDSFVRFIERLEGFIGNDIENIVPDEIK